MKFTSTILLSVSCLALTPALGQNKTTTSQSKKATTQINDTAQVQYPDLQAADLAAKCQLIKKWAATEALPLIGYFSKYTDERFKGQKVTLEMVQATDFSKPVDVAALTDRNPDYWQAI